ncbi:MAG: hypothetical protein JWN70_6837 [Planctomycetaceae bacterium]|nr:hypothetical protein [Planctomycetaceae bacterium]
MDYRVTRPVRTTCLAILLIGAAIHSAAAQAEKPAQSQRNALVVLIGGMDSDPTPEQIAGKSGRSGNSGLYRLQGDLQHPQLITEYFNWNGTRAGQIKSKPAPQAAIIAEAIRGHMVKHPRDLVVLVGNSWGGHTTYEVCHELVTSSTPVAIDYVVFLDPSSTGRADAARPKQLPININRAANFHTRNLFGWGKWPKDDRIENIDLGDEKQGFLTSGGPAYGSTFDFSAHVAAEWDERIHAAIRKRIVDLVRPAVPATKTDDAESAPADATMPPSAAGR